MNNRSSWKCAVAQAMLGLWPGSSSVIRLLARHLHHCVHCQNWLQTDRLMLAVLEEEGQLIKLVPRPWLKQTVAMIPRRVSRTDAAADDHMPTPATTWLPRLSLLLTICLAALLTHRLVRHLWVDHQALRMLELAQGLSEDLPQLINVELAGTIQKVQEDYRQRTTAVLNRARLTAQSTVQSCLPTSELFVLNDRPQAARSSR